MDAFERELRELVVKHGVHEKVGLTPELTASFLVVQFNLLKTIPRGCSLHESVQP